MKTIRQWWWERINWGRHGMEAVNSALFWRNSAGVWRERYEASCAREYEVIKRVFELEEMYDEARKLLATRVEAKRLDSALAKLEVSDNRADELEHALVCIDSSGPWWTRRSWYEDS